DKGDAYTDEQRGGRAYEPGSGCDRDKTGDRSRCKTERGGFLIERPFDKNPDKSCRRRRDVRDNEGGDRQTVRSDGGAAIKAEPAEPEEAGSDQSHRKVV